MSVLRATGVEKAFGDRHVLRGCDLDVADGERVGLVGANGSGKSTLVRVLSGAMNADHGRVDLGGTIGYLDQEPELSGPTVAACADDALAWHQALLDGHRDALAAGNLARAAELQDRLDVVGWEQRHRVEAMLDRLGAPPESAKVADLSGGERRRVALALALLGWSDVLLLDEPTNHLDAEATEWLQGTLQGWRGAVVLVTHDRYLLEAVATRIVEVEDGLCVSYPGSYADYLIERAERTARLERAEDRRLELISREAAWASRSPAARTTKQKARLQRLDALQSARPLQRESLFSLDLRTGQRFGRVLLELHGVRKRYGDRTLLGGIDLSLSPGDRVGIIGPNGAGKSTLLRIVAGDEAPDAGDVHRASRLTAAWMDQGRTGLDPDNTVFEAAGGGNDHVTVSGKAVHVASFLGRFLFPVAMLDQPVALLSGGERARLLLARLLLQGAGLLLLDEPTNDLDLNTLRVLEEALLSFDGAALVVTHDRAFLDRVCTAVLAFEGDGRVTRYASRSQAHAAAVARAAPPPAREERPAAPPRPRTRDRLSFKETRELEALPGQIEGLEVEHTALAERLGDPATYRDASVDVSALGARVSAIEAEIEALYARWQALEARAGG